MNFSHHLSDAALRALLQRDYEATSEEGAHFLVCDKCQQRARRLDRTKAESLLGSLRPASILSERLDPVALRTLSRFLEALSHEVARAEKWIGRLAVANNPEELLKNLRLDPRAFGTAVLRWSPDARQGDPRTILRLCDLALGQLAIEVPPSVCVELVAQLKAEKGNAYRILGKLVEAGRHVAEALAVLDECPDDLARGFIIELASSYFIDLLDFKRGREYSLRALSLYGALGRQENIARCRWRLAYILFMQGDLETAKERFVELLDAPVHDEMTELAAVSYLIRIHAMEGRYFAAAGLLSRLRRLAKRWMHNDALKAKLYWLRGLIVGGVGQIERGEELLRRAQRYYVAHEIPFDAALVGVDLAFLLLRAGHREEAVQATVEAIQVFQTERTKYPHALSALRLLTDAIRHDQLSYSLYRDFIRFVELAQRDPNQPFVPKKG